MKTVAWIVALGISTAAGVAIGKLPPPTPEQQEAAAAKKEAEKVNVEKEKALLEKAQDRVVQYYKKTKGGGSASASAGGGKTEAKNIPNPATQSTLSPAGGKNQSAESHSAGSK